MSVASVTRVLSGIERALPRAGRLVVVALLTWSSACADDVSPARDFDAPGAFTARSEVMTFTPIEGDLDPIDGKLWLPTPPAGQASEPVPLVVFVPALSSTWDSYDLLLEHTVTHGYAVLALNLVDQGRDQLRQVARILAATQQVLDEQGPDTLDPSRIALVGHSLGGKLALLTTTFDRPLREAFATVIAWDPVDTDDSGDGLLVSLAPERMDEVRVPTLIFGTPESTCVPLGNNHDDIFAAARSPSLHLFFPTADHVDWGNDFGEGPIGFGIARDLCDRVGELNGVVVHQVTRRSQVAWLHRHLKGVSGMERYLTGADAPELDRGTVIATEK